MPLDIKTAKEVERLASIFDALMLEAHECAAAYGERSKNVTPHAYRVAYSLLRRRQTDRAVALALSITDLQVAAIRELSGVVLPLSSRPKSENRKGRHKRS